MLYFGTPVALISTQNPDGSASLAPMSSVWWVGGSCLLGLDETSTTTINLQRTKELVLNLPDPSLVRAVDRLALYTGARDVPAHKHAKGYEFLADKFGHAGLTPVPSDLVEPPRVAECPIALEATVIEVRAFDGADSRVLAVEARIVRTHAFADVLILGSDRHIDPERWDPLIMKFTHLYGHGTRLQPSRLATGWQIPAGTTRTEHVSDADWRPELDGIDRSDLTTSAAWGWVVVAGGAALMKVVIGGLYRLGRPLPRRSLTQHGFQNWRRSPVTPAHPVHQRAEYQADLLPRQLRTQKRLTFR